MGKAGIAVVVGTLLGVALIAGAVADAEAVVLYQQAPVGSVNTPAVNSAGAGTAYDDFSLSGQAQVTSIGWIGDGTRAPRTFQISIYASVPGVPSNLPAATPVFQVTVTPTFVPDAVIFPISHYTADLGDGVVLAADTVYWLSIRNVATSHWGWNGDGGGISVSQNSSGGYAFNAISPFFTLNGEFVTDVIAVPEPATIGLFAAGLLGLAAIRRRALRPLPPR